MLCTCVDDCAARNARWKRMDDCVDDCADRNARWKRIKRMDDGPKTNIRSKRMDDGPKHDAWTHGRRREEALAKHPQPTLVAHRRGAGSTSLDERRSGASRRPHTCTSAWTDGCRSHTRRIALSLRGGHRQASQTRDGSQHRHRVIVRVGAAHGSQHRHSIREGARDM